MVTYTVVAATIGLSASLGAVVADVSTECPPINRHALKVAWCGLLAAGAALAFLLVV